MTAEQVRAVIAFYRQRFERLGVGKKNHPQGELLISPLLGLEHCHAILDKMEGFVAEGQSQDRAKENLEKAFRWLGFLQGVLWMQGIYILDEMREHNSSSN